MPIFLTVAPIGRSVRDQLLLDAANVGNTAKRKSFTLSPREEDRQLKVAKDHFELGCWMYRFSHLPELAASDYFQERVDILQRIFLAGFNNPDFDFFTVFDFGPREFEAIFEQGDSHEVVNALRREIQNDATGQIARAFANFKWAVADAATIKTA